jgi:hypothetical protein
MDLSLHSKSVVLLPHSFSHNIDYNIGSNLWEHIQEDITQNKQLWSEIHNSIRTNDLKQLTTLLSKHSINLNNFNLSTDGDTILHTAAKSNSAKMLEFVLQRISPSTRERMIKAKNKQRQLPVELVKRLAPSMHLLYPLKCRQVVKAVLMLAAKRPDGTPYYPQTHFYKLPKDVLFLILHLVAEGEPHLGNYSLKPNPNVRRICAVRVK